MIKIGNAQGFWGDRSGAAATLVAEVPDIDYITMDYLAEVSLSILAIQKEKDPTKGYAADFIEELRSLVPFWKEGRKFKVVANAGGLNPLECARQAAQVLEGTDLKIGIVSGDDVLALLQQEGSFENLDTGESVQSIHDKLVTANAYLGAKPIVDALDKGADIVITGRVADPSLTVACAVHHFKWNNLDQIAQATIAGHLIECGTQVTGGICTDWLDVPGLEILGYPVIEMQEDSTFVVTKSEISGGCVTEQTVKEQLLYEIGDPDHYLSPDVTVSFLGIQLETLGKDRIQVTGAKGKPPSTTYKVGATFRDGFTAEGTLTLFGRHLYSKAHRCGEIVLSRVAEKGYKLQKSLVECLGGGDLLPGVVSPTPDWDLKECVLRIAVADPRKEAIACFAKEIAPLVTSGSQGVTGYVGGRPKVRPVFGFWPCLIEKERVLPRAELL